MVLPAHLATLAPLPAPPVPCGLDRHVGPFEPLEEMADFLGTDWFCCRSCRAMVTRRNARGARVAA
ncbi:MAG TPA: hypothetical protein VE871_17585 [Longimicrobium sp.]|nr:hypothetical protein [Longimicrobium sp.]